MVSTIVVLYLSLLTETKKDIDVQLFAISKYNSYVECKDHKAFLERKKTLKLLNTPEGKSYMYFCTIISYDPNDSEKHKYIPKIPYCSKNKKNLYYCGHPI